MIRLPPSWIKLRVPAAVIMLCLLALPGTRHFLEASMARHMLVQFPLLAFIGFELAATIPRAWAERLNKWNGYGISGLFAVALVLAILMIPRVLDLALADPGIELAKWLALLSCGAALRLSWQPAGLLVQGFFLGNVLPMTAVVGYLFESSPVRVCNAYLLDDQERLGQRLVWITAGIGLAWFADLVHTMMRKEEAASRSPASDQGATESGPP